MLDIIEVKLKVAAEMKFHIPFKLISETEMGTKLCHYLDPAGLANFSLPEHILSAHGWLLAAGSSTIMKKQKFEKAFFLTRLTLRYAR